MKQKMHPPLERAKRQYQATGGRVTVYNVKTGEPVELHGIDAKERVAGGNWSFEKPVLGDGQEGASDET